MEKRPETDNIVIFSVEGFCIIEVRSELFLARARTGNDLILTYVFNSWRPVWLF